ncbi:MAG TPA: TolC family protein [Candidatus Saccharimonadales bacterium]|jgi:outer membrane protein TolC|nr:TolC family protein [Candidatus Saccharimonadales bacterium]
MRISVRVMALAGLFLIGNAALLNAQNGPLPFRTAIELALKNSTATAIGRAETQRVKAGYSQSRDLFLPQITIGSGLAFSYGFPLSLEGSAPSIFNFNAQEYLLNPAQRQFVKAAREEVGAAESMNVERRNDVILEAAVDYIQLDLLQSSLNVQKEQEEFAAKYEDIAAQRVKEGVDAATELTRARLASARGRLQLESTRSSIDQLRLRLSQMTGLAQGAIETITESIPGLPQPSQAPDLAATAAEKSFSVKAAEQAALAKAFRARGEERQLYPAIDLVAQYGLLARFNNYDTFFRRFQRHNVTAGIAVRFPFFNPAQRATARAAEADAVKAKKEALSVKEQVSGEVLRLQRSVQQLSAAREVNKLEHLLAQGDVETVHEKIQSGSANLKEEQAVRIAEHDRYAAYLDSNFQLDRAQIQLLRQTGELEGWALGPVKR